MYPYVLDLRGLMEFSRVDSWPETLSNKRLQVLRNAIKYRKLQAEKLQAGASAGSGRDMLNSELSRRNANGLLWDVVYLVAEGELSGAEIGVTDLYLTLGVSKGTTLRALDRLLEFGCVEKRRHPQDSRRTNLHLTPEFRATFDGLLNEMIEDVRRLHQRDET